MKKKYAYREVKGDLVALAKKGTFDAIAHGVNCFCAQASGLAPQMVEAFGTDKFLLEDEKLKGEYHKLGNIDWEYRSIDSLLKTPSPVMDGIKHGYDFAVINAYTQFDYGGSKQGIQNLDYHALVMCFKKIASEFEGKHIGLPQIGCGLAGGSWETVRSLINSHMKQVEVTVVIYQGGDS